MKKGILFFITAVVFFFGGFSIAIFLQGKDIEAQVSRLIIGGKLNLMNTIADEIQNTPESIESPGRILSILCDQALFLKDEALEFGQPVSNYDQPGAIIYAEKTKERYKEISNSMNMAPCNIE